MATGVADWTGGTTNVSMTIPTPASASIATIQSTIQYATLLVSTTGLTLTGGMSDVSLIGNGNVYKWTEASGATIADASPAEVRFDMGSTVTIPQLFWLLDFYAAGASDTYKFDIDGSADAITWTNIVTSGNVSGGVAAKYTELIANSQAYRYFRFAAHQKTSPTTAVNTINNYFIYVGMPLNQ